MKKLFCYLYSQWLSKFVDSKDDYLVRLIDTLSGSECKYCMAVRQWVNGFGCCLVFYSWWLTGACLIAGAYLLTLGERYLLCDVKKD